MSISRLAVLCSGLLGLQVLVAPGSALAEPALGGGSCTASWTDQPVPGNGVLGDALVAISGTSPTSLYAAGYSAVFAGDVGRVMRNTGSGWTDLTLPGPTSATSFLTGALSTTPNTAWVSGAGEPGTGTGNQAVLFRVVGNTATAVTLPAAPPDFPYFGEEGMPLASAGGTDLWTGGDWFSTQGASEGLLFHQSGPGTWTTTVVPSGVNSIAAISPTAAYVAGGGLSLVSDGTVSNVVQPGHQVQVSNVIARNADDVWTLGATATAAQVIEHFNGTSWTMVPDPAAAGLLNAIAVAPNGTLWATGAATSAVTGLDESTLARFDPVSRTWAITHATATTVTGNLPAGFPSGLLPLSNGNVYMVGGGGLAATPVAAKLCQLPVSLSGGASTIDAATLGDGVLVTSPQGMSGSATVSDTTGLLSAGPLRAGQGAALPGLAAGTFTLRTTAGSARATFAVPPTSSTFNFKTTVTIATKAAPAGYAYQVQMMRPGSTTWVTTPLSAKSNGVAKYLYSVLYPAGNYLLRSRVERLATSTTSAVFSGWSPPVTAVVES